MAKKPYTYAMYEGLAQEMRKNPKVTMIFQLSIPVTTLPTGEVIDFLKEFGAKRCYAAPIDEDMNVYMGAGSALTGNPVVASIPNMTNMFVAESLFEQMSKLRAMTGGQASCPIIILMGGAARIEGPAAQHNDVGVEGVYASFPGVKVVVPSNSYDAKGLMVAALHQKDPVVFFSYSEAGSSAPVEVPDDQYEVAIGKAVVRQEGKDITLVAWAPATVDADQAVANLTKAGISVEYIDLRSLKPLDTATLFASVKKTGKMLVVEHGPYVGFSSHVVSEVAQFVPGAKVRKITFPDAPGPAAKEMILWMRPDGPKIVDAVTKMVKGTV